MAALGPLNGGKRLLLVKLPGQHDARMKVRVYDDGDTEIEMKRPRFASPAVFDPKGWASSSKIFRGGPFVDVSRIRLVSRISIGPCRRGEAIGGR